MCVKTQERYYNFYMKHCNNKKLEISTEVFVPSLLSCNLRGVEDLGSIVPLVGGDWNTLWCVAVAHNLQGVINRKRSTNQRLCAKYSRNLASDLAEAFFAQFKYLRFVLVKQLSDRPSCFSEETVS